MSDAEQQAAYLKYLKSIHPVFCKYIKYHAKDMGSAIDSMQKMKLMLYRLGLSKDNLITGAKAKLKINGVVIAEAQNVSYEIKK